MPFPRAALCGLLSALLLALCAGCASATTAAERALARMWRPDATPREEVLLRREIIRRAPESAHLLSRLFFPIGLYDAPEAALFDAAAGGFNLILNGDTTPSYLARAEALGLRVIPYIRVERMAEDVADARGARALFAWYLADEPDLNDLAPERYREQAARLRRLDPARPIFLTVLSPRRYEEYADACDIFATTLYPVRRDDDRENTLWSVGWAVEAARRAAGDRPVWAVLQAFHAAPIWERNPTPDELRVMAFLALNHGASGLLFFSWKSGDRTLPEHEDLYAAILELNAQVTALRGPLLLPPMPWAPAMTVTKEEKDDTLRFVQLPERAAQRPPLDCSLRSLGRAHLFIAVNPDPWGKTVAIALPTELAGRRITEIYSTADDEPLCGEIPPDGGLELDFLWHDVRLFWIE